MKRDIFKRGVRMTHKFGEIEAMADPLGGVASTFTPKFPIVHNNLENKRNNSAPIELSEFGEDRYFVRPNSAVCKPNGNLASLAGPAIDYAEALAKPIPVGTKKRKDHLKTDK